MRKYVLPFLVFVFLLVLLNSCAREEKKKAQEGGKLVNVKVDSANIRSGPSTQSKVIAGAKWNDKLLVIEEREEWYKVKLPGGEIGWIYRPLCSSGELHQVKVKPKEAKQTIERAEGGRLIEGSRQNGICDRCGKELSAWEILMYSNPQMELCKSCYKEMEAMLEGFKQAQRMIEGR